MATYDTGTQAIIGWANEPTPGTPVAAANYIPLMPGSATPDFDQGMKQIEIAAGSINVCMAIVPKNGRGVWSITTELFPSLNASFTTQCGLSGSGIAAPGSFTLTASAKGKAYQYPGCRCTRIRIVTDASTGAQITYSGVFTGRPVPVAALAAPSITGEDPYTYDDFGAVTLVTGATTSATADCQKLDLTIDLPHAMGYGNSGVALPNILALAKVLVGGTVSLFFSSVNFAEFTAANIQNGTAGAMGFSWAKPSPSTKSITVALGNVKYAKGSIAMPKDQLDLLNLPFMSFAPNLANQLTWTIT